MKSRASLGTREFAYNFKLGSCASTNQPKDQWLHNKISYTDNFYIKNSDRKKVVLHNQLESSFTQM